MGYDPAPPRQEGWAGGQRREGAPRNEGRRAGTSSQGDPASIVRYFRFSGAVPIPLASANRRTGSRPSLEEDLCMSHTLSFRIAFVAAFLALLVSAPTALAGKGGGRPRGGGTTGGRRSLGLVLLDSTDGVAHHGQRVTFTATTTATDRPFVRLDCYQGSVWV